MREKIARAIWETWRKSRNASEEASLLTWEELSAADADSFPGLAELTEVAFSEADAVLDAMREPTEEMLIGARDWSMKKYGLGVGNDGSTGCWQAMIDAAKEQR